MVSASGCWAYRACLRVVIANQFGPATVILRRSSPRLDCRASVGLAVDHPPAQRWGVAPANAPQQPRPVLRTCPRSPLDQGRTTPDDQSGRTSSSPPSARCSTNTGCT